jgi:EcsC protein family
MKFNHPFPDSLAESAAFLTLQERTQLWHAAILMADSRGAVMRLTALFGRQVEAVKNRLFDAGERLGGAAWADLVQNAQDAVEDTLWRSYDLATFGLDAAPLLLRPRQPRNNALHRLATTASGVASGFVGLPGVVFDIPFTTATILRSIAEVARDSGEDLANEETKRSCLEVLALGGPSHADDETEIGYWATRIGVSHLTVNLLIRAAAGRFGLVVSEKFLAQAVPVAGALAGGVLNYTFTDYYQTMARVHFCLRALERRTGDPGALSACFAQMVREARHRRRFGRRAAGGTVFLPAR